MRPEGRCNPLGSGVRCARVAGRGLPMLGSATCVQAFWRGGEQRGWAFASDLYLFTGTSAVFLSRFLLPYTKLVSFCFQLLVLARHPPIHPGSLSLHSSNGYIHSCASGEVEGRLVFVFVCVYFVRAVYTLLPVFLCVFVLLWLL